MTRPWIERSAILGCALLALSVALSRTKAQEHRAPFDRPQTGILTLEGPAIHIVVTAHLPGSELRQLATDSRTAQDHPDLAQYYRSRADRLQAEAEEEQRIARAFGDPKPLNAPDHFNIGRNARHYHVLAKESLKRAQSDNLLAGLYAQAAQGEGCFSCHGLHGRGGKIAPDLAAEGNRGRSRAWLIGHFKNPQAYSSTSVMPALAGLTNPQLDALTSFVQYQTEK